MLRGFEAPTKVYGWWIFKLNGIDKGVVWCHLFLFYVTVLPKISWNLYWVLNCNLIYGIKELLNFMKWTFVNNKLLQKLLDKSWKCYNFIVNSKCCVETCQHKFSFKNYSKIYSSYNSSQIVASFKSVT